MEIQTLCGDKIINMRVLFVYSSLGLEKCGNQYYHNFLGTIIKRYSFFGDLTVCTSCTEVAKSNRELVDMTGVRQITLVKENTVKTMLDKSYNNRIIREEVPKCDLLISHQPDGVAGRAAKMARRLGIPCLTVVIGCPWDALWNYDWRGKILAPYEYLKTKSAIAQTDYAIYVTEKFLQRRYPTTAPQIACSDVITEDIPVEVCKNRQKVLFTKERSSPMKIITLAGIDVPFKGQKYIIEAIARLNRQGWNYHYYVAGAGTGEALMKKAQELGVENYFHILGTVSHDKIYDVMADMDIYAQPSRLEGLPRALVEAMSCGLPAIGTNVGGIPELLQDDVLFGKGNVNDIVKVLAREPKEWASKVEINYNRAKDFNQDVLNKRRYDFFEKIKNEIFNYNMN